MVFAFGRPSGVAADRVQCRSDDVEVASVPAGSLDAFSDQAQRLIAVRGFNLQMVPTAARAHLHQTSGEPKEPLFIKPGADARLKSARQMAL